LQEQGITHVLDLSGISYTKYPEFFRYLSIDIDDDPKADLARHFPTTNAFIEEALNGSGGVLVHCQACISRSPGIVVAYLLYRSRRTADELSKIDVDGALDLVRRVRGQARPNDGFMRQLRTYCSELDTINSSDVVNSD